MPTLRLRRTTPRAVAAVLLGLLGAFGCQSEPEPLAKIDDSIIGGRLDTTHKGVVSLLKAVRGGFYPSCSGTLLTPNLVLTARHCVAALSSGDAESVECGKTVFQDSDAAASLIVSVETNVGREGQDPFQVADVWVPAGSSEVCGRDIALLLLAGSGVPASAATPIEPRLGTKPQANEMFEAIGYGLQDPQDETGKTAGHRMSVTTAQVFCEGLGCGTQLVADGEFIADSPVCSGDSGGPALDRDGRVSGVTSRGDQKCTVGIYSSVEAWRDFILEKTFLAAQSGHYLPPAWAGELPAGFDLGVAALGASCSGQCPAGYKCWAEFDQPPGICVPACSTEQSSCPVDYTCDEGLQACIKPSQHAEPDGSSCSVKVVGSNADQGAVLTLGALGALSLYAWRRRRRQLSVIA